MHSKEAEEAAELLYEESSAPKEEFEAWLRDSDTVIKIPDNSPEMDLRVFMATYPALKCRLLADPAPRGPAVAGGGGAQLRVPGAEQQPRRRLVTKSLFNVESLLTADKNMDDQTRDLMRLQKRHLKSLCSLVEKTRKAVRSLSPFSAPV